MSSHNKIKSIFTVALAFAVSFASAQTPVPVVRNNGVVTAVDYNVSIRNGLKIPVFIDTTHALQQAGIDSIGYIFKEFITSKMWVRDSNMVAGGHVWTLFGTGGGGGGITALTGDVLASGSGSVGATIAASAVTNAKMANMGASTFKGNNTSTGPPLDLSVTQAIALLLGSNNGYLSGNGSGSLSSATTIPTTALSGTLQAGQEPAHTGDVTNTAGSLGLTIASNAVSNAKAAQMGAGTIKSNLTGGTANASDNSVASVAAAFPLVTTSAQGMAPASGGGTTNFLRADLTWAAPPSTGVSDSGLHSFIQPFTGGIFGNPIAVTTSVAKRFILGDTSATNPGAIVTQSSRKKLADSLTNLSVNLNVLRQGQPGDTPVAALSGNLMIAAMRDSLNFHHTVNPDGSWTLYATGGGGSIGGSIANTQVAVGSGTNTIAGSSSLTFGSSLLTTPGLTVTNDVLIHGLTFGLGHSSVAHNTAGGLNALAANTTGDYQTAYGASALASVTNGTWNTAVGGLAGFSATTGNYMVAVGQGACQNCNADYNVAVGVGTLNTNTTHNDNVAVGGLALHSSDAYGNTAVGKWAFTLNTSGQHNTGIGLGAGSGVVTGNENFAGGYLSLDLAVGNSSQNTAVGAYALQLAQGPQNNTVLGWAAAMQNTTLSDSNSIEIGSAAFGVIGTQHYRLNTIGIGNMIGYPLSTVTNTDATWSHCILAGDSLTNNSSIQYIANTTAIGHNLVISQSNAFYLGTASQYFIIGNGGMTTTARLALTKVAGSIVWDNTLGEFFYTDGSSWTPFASGSAGVTTVGTFSGSSLTNGASISGPTITFGPADATNQGMVTTGTQAFAGVKTFNSDLLINSGSIRVGKGVSTGTNNTGLGTTVFNTAGSYGDCTAVGFDVLFNNTGNQNTGVGSHALIFNTSGINNVALGYEASDANTTGSNNTAVGWAALLTGQTFSNNTALGYQALKASGASNNTAVGASTLIANTTGTYNDAVGTGALGANTVGNYNLGIGSLVAQHLDSGSNDIYIGNFVDAINHKENGIIRLGSGIVGYEHVALTNASAAVDSSQLLGIGMIPLSTATLSLIAGTTSLAPLNIQPSSGVVLTTPVNGAVENDGTFTYVTEGGLRYIVNPTIFSQTANGTALTNSTTSTALMGTGTTSRTIPANTLRVGNIIHWEGYLTGTGAGSGAGSLNLEPTIGGNGLANGFAVPNTLFNVHVVADVTILTLGSSATATLSITMTVDAGTSSVLTYMITSGTGTTFTFNSTTSNVLDMFGQFSVASSSNSIQTLPPFATTIK